MQEVQGPKRTSNRCGNDHDKNENKVLLCSPSHRTFKIYFKNIISCYFVPVFVRTNKLFKL